MLQSGQVSQEALLEALTSEYYPSVFRLAFAILDNQRTARKTAERVFVRAMLEQHRYQPQQSLEVWLYRLALEVCGDALGSLELRRKFVSSIPFLTNLNLLGDTLPGNELNAEIWLAVDRLEPGLRLVLILRLLLDWQPSRIEALTGNPAKAVDEAIHEVQKALPVKASPTQPVPRTEQLPASDVFVAALKTSLEKRWQPISLDQSDQERTLTRINRQVRTMQTRRQGIFSAMEIGLVVLIILVGAGILWGINILGETQATPKPAIVTLETVMVTRIIQRNITVAPNPFSAGPLPISTPYKPLPSQYSIERTGERLEDLAKRLNVAVDPLRELNRLPEGVVFKSGQRLLLPAQWGSVTAPSPTPVPQTAPARLLESPYPAELVIQRLTLENPRYNTLWIDARVIDYGPVSYIGPPGILRGQVWESKDQWLSLIGYAGELPQDVTLRIKNAWRLARPQADPAWFSEWRDDSESNSPFLRAMLRMNQALFDAGSLEYSSISVLGREEQAGVQTLVLEVFNQAGLLTDRIWFDDSRGMILRRIFFQPGEETQPIFEVAVESIAYDIELPPGLFDARLPWRGGFARDASGAPEEILEQPGRPTSDYVRFDAEPAPLNFNPARSRLLFQFPHFYALDSPPTTIELLADSYSLGPVLFGNPWQTICRRSPDGKWLAYAGIPVDKNAIPAPLTYFDLADPEQSYKPPGFGKSVTSFAFSPDSRRLAYFARPDSNENGTVNILDLQTHQSEPVLSIGDVNSLIWNPDGASLAMIARVSPDTYLENVIIFDVENKQITYNASIDVLSHSAGDWSLLDWGVEFPVEMGNMDACSNPPPL